MRSYSIGKIKELYMITRIFMIKNITILFDKRIVILIFFSAMYTYISILKLKTEVTYYEFMLSVISDDLFIIGFIIPFFIYNVLRVSNDFNIDILIRSSKRRYKMGEIISIWFITWINILLMVLTIAVVSKSLFDMSNVFISKENLTIMRTDTDEIAIYREMFSTPKTALICVIVYLSIGMSLLSLVINIIISCISKQLVIFTVGLMVVISNIGEYLNIKCGLLMFLDMKNYCMLYKVVESNTLLKILVIFIEVVLAFYLFIQYGSERNSDNLTSYW